MKCRKSGSKKKTQTLGGTLTDVPRSITSNLFFCASVFVCACSEGHVDIVQYLCSVLDIKSLPKPQNDSLLSYQQHPLYYAWKNKKPEMVKYLMNTFGFTRNDLYIVGGITAYLGLYFLN